jgi:hypothetical protein
MVIDDRLPPDEERAIQQGLVAFGDAHTPPRNYRPLARYALRLAGAPTGPLLFDRVFPAEPLTLRTAHSTCHA